VNGYALLLEHLQYADVRGTASATTGEHKTHSRSRISRCQSGTAEQEDCQ